MSITLETIAEQLNGLRMDVAALAAQLKPAAHTYSAPATSGSSSDAGVPQPTWTVDDPGSVSVHFGKNTGKALRDLTERQLGWYAMDPEPRLDSSGKPFPPRPQDVALRQACRQLWHTQKGTLGAAATAAPVAEKKPADAVEENVPF